MSRKQSFYTLNVECICDLCLPFFAIYTGPPPEYVSSQVSSAHRVTDTDIVSATRINSVNNNPSTHAGSLRQQPVFQGPPPEYVHSQVSPVDRVTDTDIVSATRINSVNNNPSTHAGSSRQQPVFQGNYE
ncbi:hypothetical protein Tco_1426514 [Tanacetum coccineum]